MIDFVINNIVPILLYILAALGVIIIPIIIVQPKPKSKFIQNVIYGICISFAVIALTIMLLVLVGMAHQLQQLNELCL